MTQWTMMRWHGAPERLAAALREFGWFGPDETPCALPDPRVGGFLPQAGQALHVLDGVAYAALAVRTPLALPPDLAETGPDLSTALLGSF
ncbi:MAG TPA: hypothetical protein VE033_04740 [Acetobacteraceae bacterium]|nr:hypothetical protein [Acetobacteraceae bacterium]